MPETLAQPVNYRRQDASPDAVSRDVDYAVQVALNYANWIGSALHDTSAGLSVASGLRILELGPGPSLGTAILLAAAGARVTVADRFAAQWDEDYHPKVMRGLIERARTLPGVEVTLIEDLVRANDFAPHVVTFREYAAEELQHLPKGSVDVVLSNAVLEHLVDVPQAFAGLAHITARGGVGLHQVDFRDHRDFSRPLEYLTMSDADFRAMFAERNGECGNRWRPKQMARAFEAAGMPPRVCAPNMSADPAYVEEIRPRLHPDVLPMETEELEVISAYFVVERR